MIDLVLVKKAMMPYVQDLMAIRRMEVSHIIMYCVKLVRWEVVNGVRRTRCEKLREHKYLEGYARCLESKSRRMKVELLGQYGSS